MDMMGMTKPAVSAQKTMNLPNQTAVHYLVQGDPGGDTLIMLHGIADSCRIFEEETEEETGQA